MAEVQVGAPAPDVRLLRADGRAATLRELGSGEPAVLFFLRHYG